MDWIHKALKDSHQDEMAYHKASLNELNRRYNQILQRLDRLYDDKSDEKIREEFYQRKLKQYSEEKEEVSSAIQRHSKANIKYYELGINLSELSQRAKEIYLNAMKEEKRQLLNLVFDNLLLKEETLIYNFSKPFELLSKAIKVTNGSKVANLTETPLKIFEPSKIGLNKGKNRDFLPVCPIKRREWDDFRTLKWLDLIDSPELIMKEVQELLQST